MALRYEKDFLNPKHKVNKNGMVEGTYLQNNENPFLDKASAQEKATMASQQSLDMNVQDQYGNRRKSSEFTLNRNETAGNDRRKLRFTASHYSSPSRTQGDKSNSIFGDEKLFENFE